MVNKQYSEGVAERFLKVMKQVIANELQDITTQKEFADKVGEYAQNISKIESGTRYPTIEMLCNTCIIFNVDPGWLLLEKGTMFGKENEQSLLERVIKLEKQMKKQKV